ncbi:MAG: hypothetical protein PHS57_09140 [Alphaproteobacteria bacterium]|nr:hypothetical protein [Alphaproteobacteria bacterium]
MSLNDTFCISETMTATVAENASLTETIACRGLRLASVTLPSAWTTANLTFQTSFDEGATWVDLHDQNGNEVVAVAAPGVCTVLFPSLFASLRFVRVRSGTSLTPIAQEAARSLILILRAV